MKFQLEGMKMEIIFGKKEGIPEFFRETANMKKSAVSNDSIDIFVDADGSVIFYPKSGRIAAFSLSGEDMEKIDEESLEKAIDDAFPSGEEKKL